MLLGRGPRIGSRQNVQLGRLVNRLDRVAAEELVAPGDQHLDVLDEHILLVSHGAHAGDEVGVERVVAPFLYLLAQFGITLGDGQHDVLDLLLVVVGLRGFVERLGDPVLLLRRVRIGGSSVGASRVKDVMEPFQRLFEALVSAQLVGDEERHVEEQLPVVGRVSAQCR